MFSSRLPPARIFLCRHVGGRGKKRASLCYEAKRRRSAVFVVAKTPPTLGITRYIVIYIYIYIVAANAAIFSGPGEDFRHCPSPIFRIIVSPLGSIFFEPRFFFFLRFNKNPGQITTFEVFIDREARDRGRSTKVETRARHNGRLAPRKIARGLGRYARLK